MKKKLLLLVALLSFSFSATRADQFVNLTPQPKTLTTGTGSLSLPAQFTIGHPDLPDSLVVEAERLAERLTATTGLAVSVSDATPGALIRMSLPAAADFPAEGYRLSVTTDGVSVEARTSAGFFYAFQTLKKLLPAHVSAGVADPAVESYALPVVTIEDEPRFGYRGFMLDVARHFYSVEEVKRMLDLMATYKLNRFHWHLSDDQGWRAEIKRWPKLTTVGSIAPNSYQWDWTCQGYYTNRQYGPYFYTQDEMRDVVAYAKRLHIEVIPEIDMPGHFVAAMTAYPEFSCTPEETHQNWIPWGVSSDVLNVANAAAVDFAKDILDELTDIFPYEYIHIGGDECPTTAWENNAECRAKMQEEGMTDSRQLQSHFIRDMADFLRPKGHKLFVWNEAISAGNADLEAIKATGATIMCWTGPEAAAQKAAQLGLNNVMTPYFYYYINRKQRQDASWMAVAGDGNDDLKRTYDYSPIPSGTSAAQQRYFQGVQGTFWTEHVSDPSLLHYLALPRLMAIAETGWSPEEKKDFAGFCRRMAADTVMLQLGGYRFSPHYLRETTETGQVMPKTSTADARYYYRLVTRATGDRYERCIELLAEGSPLIDQYADKQARAGRLWTNAQAAADAANYDYQLWAFEADPAGSGKYALVCKALPEGSLSPTPTGYATAGRWDYDNAGKHYNFRLGTTRYGEDGDYYYYSVYNDANDNWAMSAAGAAQGLSVNLWNSPADGGNGSDWKFVPQFSETGAALQALAARAENYLTHGRTYAEGESAAPGKFSATAMEALRSLTADLNPETMSPEEQAAYTERLTAALDALEASRGRLTAGETYRVRNAVEGFENIVLDDQGKNNLTHTTEPYAADTWTATAVAETAEGNEQLRLQNAVTGRFVGNAATSASGYVGYAVAMATDGTELTAAYDASHGDYALTVGGKKLFPVAADANQLGGTVAAGSNGNQAGDAVRLQGNAWLFEPVCLVTYVCRDEQGEEIGRYYQSADKGAAFTAEAPTIENYALKGYGETGTAAAPTQESLDEPQTVTAVYRRSQFVITYDCRDPRGGIIAREESPCKVGETFTLSQPEFPYYDYEGSDYDGPSEFVPTSDLLIRLSYATTAMSGVRSLGPAVTTLEDGMSYVVENTASNLERRGFLYVSPTSDQVLTGGTAEGKSPAHTWRFERSGNGFKVRNGLTDKYIPAVNSAGAVNLSATGDTFTPSAGAEDGTFRFKGTNGLWWNGNRGSFTGWSDGHDFTIHEFYAEPYFKVEIAYVDTEGRQLSPATSTVVKAGAAYTLVVPAIENYEMTDVTGGSERLEAVGENLSLTIVYKSTTPAGIDAPLADAPATTVIYDLSGRRLQAIRTPGFYIVNGKKLMVRRP